ncbi:MAG: hypothetical protein EVJ48_08775 [Candidatus Acidulodesulfobacterium acidiphilum]|uniref:Uncharacterized protein n=1 Tax=Candidatus Acidulodesulfobacterium acidiphilum TaxID=2597224 RepID=A0A520X8R4_9DELT|nr:MAG: hypothetical protein EVJ48_08775 [Candidatus Acidulodesulfobacterium acidiphilum]
MKKLIFMTMAAFMMLGLIAVGNANASYTGMSNPCGKNMSNACGKKKTSMKNSCGKMKNPCGNGGGMK